MDAWLIWFLIGVTFFLLEFVAPGVVLVFFAMGAGVSSVTTLLGWTESLNSQLITFTIASIVALVILRSTVKRWFEGDAKEERLSKEFIGHHVRVTEAIPGGDAPGKVEHKGANWNAVAEKTVSEGRMVEIVEMDGLTFKVKLTE